MALGSARGPASKTTEKAMQPIALTGDVGHWFGVAEPDCDVPHWLPLMGGDDERTLAVDHEQIEAEEEVD